MLTPNQERMIARFPHMEAAIRGSGSTVTTLPAKPRTPLALYDACPHRGPFIDLKSCGCTAWECKIHTKCTTTRRAAQRFSLQLCQECSEFQPAQ